MVNRSMARWMVEVVWGVWLASTTVLEMDVDLDLGGSDFVGPCYGSGSIDHFVYALFNFMFSC